VPIYISQHILLLPPPFTVWGLKKDVILGALSQEVHGMVENMALRQTQNKRKEEESIEQNRYIVTDHKVEEVVAVDEVEADEILPLIREETLGVESVTMKEMSVVLCNQEGRRMIGSLHHPKQLLPMIVRVKRMISSILL